MSGRLRNQVGRNAGVDASARVGLSSALLQVSQQGGRGQAEEQRDWWTDWRNEISSPGISASVEFTRPSDCTNVQTRCCTGFQLKLGQFQRFTTRWQVLAGDRNALLIVTCVDIGRNNAGEEGQAGNIALRIGASRVAFALSLLRLYWPKRSRSQETLRLPVEVELRGLSVARAPSALR